MVYMTNLLERKKRMSDTPKKPPLALRNLPIEKELQKSERPLMSRSTDRIMELSERFGKIVKQKHGKSVKGGKENIELRSNESRRVLREIPVNPIKKEYKRSLKPNNNLLDTLLRRAGKNNIKEPYDTHVYQVFNREKVIEIPQAKSIYMNAMKELNKMFMRQKQSVKVFGENTLFTPILLQALTKKFESTRWLQLYLIKILHKKLLVGHVKELMKLGDKYNEARIEYKYIHRKLVKEKAKQHKESKTIRPFLCGKANNKYVKPKEPIIDHIDMQELSLKASIAHDKLEKLRLKLAFDLIRFEYLIKRERDTYLSLILNNEAKAIYHFFMGALMHYTKVRKEKNELIELIRGKISDVLMQHVLFAWRDYRGIKNDRLEKLSLGIQRCNERLLYRSLKAFVLNKMMKGRLRLLKKTVNEYGRIRLIDKGFYLLQYFVRYRVQLRKKIRNEIEVVNRIQLEHDYKSKIKEHKVSVLSRAEDVLKRKFKLIRERRRIVPKLAHRTHKTYKAISRVEYSKLAKYRDKVKRKSINSLNNTLNVGRLREHAMAMWMNMKNIKEGKTHRDLMKYRVFTTWRGESALSVIQKDIETIRGLLMCKRFLRLLLGNLRANKDKQREAQKEYELKLEYNIIKKWREITKTERAKREERLYLSLLQRYFNKLKKFIPLRVQRVNNKIKAVRHFQTKVKHKYLEQLMKQVNYRKKVLTYKLEVITRHLFLKWRNKRTIRNTLRRVFRDSMLFYNERKKAAVKDCLKTKFKKWREVTIDSPEAVYERKLYLPAKRRYRSFLLTRILNHWKQLLKTNKAVNSIIKIFYDKIFRRYYNRWIKATENHLKKVIVIKTRYANRLRVKSFGYLKREYIIIKLAKLFRLQKIMQSWFNQVKREHYIEPIKYHNTVIKHKVFIALRNNLKYKLIKKRNELIGNEIEYIHKQRLKDNCLNILLEYKLSKEKKRLIMKTVNEFHEICLLRKSFVGIARNAEKQKLRHIQLVKALNHYKKVKERREELKRIISNFNKCEYGLSHVLLLS